jgi:threonine/homoserine/homoserine lactone efflux protein
MNAAWLTTPNVATFLIASLLLAITPGPGVIYLLTQTLTGGRRAGFASVAGIALGIYAALTNPRGSR